MASLVSLVSLASLFVCSDSFVELALLFFLRIYIVFEPESSHFGAVTRDSSFVAKPFYPRSLIAMSSDDEHPPKELLRPISSWQASLVPADPDSMASKVSSSTRSPCQITFPNRESEIQYLQKFRNTCSTFDGTPDQFSSWFKETSLFLAQQSYPETDHPYIIRHLLIDDALDFYLAHEDLVFNFCDLRKLFLRKLDALAPLRSISSLDSIASITFTAAHPALSSTQINTTAPLSSTLPTGATTISFAQSLEDLTQNDIRKTILEDLQRNTPKFTGDH